ncbi:hypothetical protein [Phenylobacterium sp.]|uniref:hypothetical protein n=1 Tax=Phenylobacterium sp. TaxID=1871053 RepID=UPI0025E6CEDC|nr:hypothetical protein [Phenylobacterium sp.]MBX3484341.1 hypothetical protein [Phenylobacterium sp.]MCW5759343.1 hypothetical protein [Phenylobacterium sp.]
MSRSPSPDALDRAPWLAAAVFSAVLAVAFAWPSWPGYMSYDSLFAYEQALYGVGTSLWPPLHTYMFVASRAVGADTWGVLLAQTFALLFGAALVLHSLVARRALAWTLWALFVGGLAFFPTLLGSMMAHWRDVPTGSFAVLGFGLWLQAARLRSWPLLILAVVSFGVSVGLRYNAFVLAAPALLLMVWRPFLGAAAPIAARAATLALVVASLGLAWASTQWRLPDLARLPDAKNIAGTQLFDVIGISACSGVNYLPKGVTGGRPITVAQIRRAYDPRHLLSTLAPHPGQPKLLETDAGGQVGEAWARLLTAEPGCYLAHRSAVFVEQMGMLKEGVFYPVHGGIDANAFGLALSHPGLADKVGGYVRDTAPEFPRRPFWLYVGAVVLGLAAAARARQHAVLLLAILAGILAYPALLFIAGPAADARYIFPSSAMALLLCVLSLGLLAGRGSRR